MTHLYHCLRLKIKCFCDFLHHPAPEGIATNITPGQIFHAAIDTESPISYLSGLPLCEMVILSLWALESWLQFI